MDFPFETLTSVSHKDTIGGPDRFKSGDNWTIFVERLDIYMDANNIEKPRKVFVLLLSISVEVYEILRNLCNPQLPKNKTYDELIHILSEQFQPKSTVYRTRVLFDSLKQGMESVDQWYEKVVRIANQCEFGMSMEERIRDKFIAGMKPGPVLNRLCTEEKELKDLLDLAVKEEEKIKENRSSNSSPVNKKRKVIEDHTLCCCYSEEIETPDKLNYNFYSNNNGYVKFKVRAANNAMIALTTTSIESDPMYEVIIGGCHNTKSVIRKNRTAPGKVEVPTSNILDSNEFRTFWICWMNNTISVGHDNNCQPFMVWIDDDEHVPIHYIGLCTGWGATGLWILHQGGTPLKCVDDNFIITNEQFLTYRSEELEISNIKNQLAVKSPRTNSKPKRRSTRNLRIKTAGVNNNPRDSDSIQPEDSLPCKKIKFDLLKQGTESVGQWYLIVENFGLHCFGINAQSRITDKFVAGMKQGPILDRLCQESTNTNVRDLLELAMKKEIEVNNGMTNSNSAKKAKKPIIKSKEKMCYCYTKEFETSNKLEYIFYSNINGYLKFKVKAANSAHIALNSIPAESDTMYEIIIGTNNNLKSIIRKNRTSPNKIDALSPNILSPNEFRTFWICWDMKTIYFGCNNNPQPLMKWTDDEYIPIRYVGFCTGDGASGSWIIHQEGTPFKTMYNNPSSTVINNWVFACKGELPSNGFVGGKDVRSQLYVVRCNYRGNLIPGKFHTEYKTAYIPWNGSEIEFDQYEVLCNCNGRWISSIEGRIPPNAIVGGYTKRGEALYIGRVAHLGTVTIGKVPQNDGRCLIPYGGREYKYEQYEILVS